MVITLLYLYLVLLLLLLYSYNNNRVLGQPDEVANPAPHCQLNTEMFFSLC